LKKTKEQKGNLAIDMKASLCPNLVKFSIIVTIECSDSSPYTNCPIICPYYGNLKSNPVVWSYNFKLHLLSKHPSISSEDHNDILALTKLESEGMKHIWGNRSKQWNVCQKSQHAPIVISEAHHSCLVLKYIFPFCFINDSTDAQIYSSEVVEGSDTSDEGSASDCSSSHDEMVIEPDDKDEGITPTLVVAEADDDGEIEDLEYDCE
jgi:hypothetical protein